MAKKIVFYNRIKELRKEKGLSQTELAEKAGTTQVTISSIEKGYYAPTAYTSGLIAMALDSKWEDVFKYKLEEQEDKGLSLKDKKKSNKK